MSLSTKKVEVEPYNPEWKKWFETITQRIREHLGDELLGIEHYGSTSVEGLMAKPRIDIMLICRKDNFELVREKLLDLHYKHVGDLGVTGRENFRLTDEDLIKSLPTHNLNVCKEGALELRKMLTFRDELRKSQELRDEYKQLKLDLAKAHPTDVDKYADGKSEFVMKVLKPFGLDYKVNA